MQVLLLFPRADAQCNTLERAAVVGRYDLDVARSADAALQSFVVRQHDVVVVDTRQGSDVDAEAFARSAHPTILNVSVAWTPHNKTHVPLQFDTQCL